MKNASALSRISLYRSSHARHANTKRDKFIWLILINLCTTREKLTRLSRDLQLRISKLTQFRAAWVTNHFSSFFFTIMKYILFNKYNTKIYIPCRVDDKSHKIGAARNVLIKTQRSAHSGSVVRVSAARVCLERWTRVALGNLGELHDKCLMSCA